MCLHSACFCRAIAILIVEVKFRRHALLVLRAMSRRGKRSFWFDASQPAFRGQLAEPL